MLPMTADGYYDRAIDDTKVSHFGSLHVALGKETKTSQKPTYTAYYELAAELHDRRIS